MLYLIVATPIPVAKAGSLDEVVAQAENAIIPCLKALAKMERKKKLSDITVVSETATVVMAEFQSRAEANKSVISLSSSMSAERPRTGISMPVYGSTHRETLQQQPLYPVLVTPVRRSQDSIDAP